MTRQTGVVLLALVLLLAGTEPALAHEQAGQAQGFRTGFLHPLSGLDHVLAMIAVGLWGAQLGPPALWLLPVTFPLVMAFGGFLGLMGVPLPGVEIGIALSALLLGAMVGGRGAPPAPAAAALVGFFAVFHGHAHGTELPRRAERPGLQHRLRRRDRAAPRRRHRHRRRSPVAGGASRAARGRRCGGPGRRRVPVEGHGVTPGPVLAHLVTTGLGPVYDGISHVFMSPDDLVPILALSLLAGLNGPAAGRSALFALTGAWLAGGVLGFISAGAGAPCGEHDRLVPPAGQPDRRGSSPVTAPGGRHCRGGGPAARAG